MTPLTILAGYLGAGKTTLLNQLLAATERSIGVLVNDFGALNVDAELIKAESGALVSLTNGCVCCSIQDDLGAALQAMRQVDVEHIVMEASGVALPAKIAEQVQGWFDLSGVFVVVDALNVERQLQDKFVKHLLREQIQQADVVIMRKTDLQETPALMHDFDKVLLNIRSGFELEQLLCSEAAIRGRRDLQIVHDVENVRAGPGENLHAQYASTSWSDNTALSREQVTAFLLKHPEIVRAKGWFNDLQGRCWLLQAVADQIHISPEGRRKPSQLVFIYPKSMPLSFPMV